MQGVSYTTGVPAMIGAMMFLKGLWNYPVLLTLDPLIDAIAAGNTAVVKPSGQYDIN